MDNEVIILGGNHHNTLGVIRSLGEKNISPILILIDKTQKGFTSKSKYIKKTFFVENAEEGISILEKIAENLKEKGVLITTNDKSAKAVDNKYYLLSKYYFLPNVNQTEGLLVSNMDKEFMKNIALKSGMDVPKSWIIHQGEKKTKDVKYPCITKNVRSIDGGKTDIVICNDSKELNKVLKRGKDFLIQEYINKDYELNVLGCSINNGEKIISPGVIKKIREYPYRSGSSSFSVIVPFEEVNIDFKVIENYIKAIKYDGIFSIEFVSKDSINYFLEINLRNDGNGYISTAAGLNLPYIWYCSKIGQTSQIDKNEITLPFYFMEDFTDFRHVLSKRITFRQWWIDRKRTNCFLMYNKNDKRPFFNKLRLVINDIIKSKL